MYAFTLSTPDRANCYVSRRTHKNLMKAWGAFKEGHALYWIRNGKARYIGTVTNGAISKGN